MGTGNKISEVGGGGGATLEQSEKSEREKFSLFWCTWSNTDIYRQSPVKSPDIRFIIKIMPIV